MIVKFNSVVDPQDFAPQVCWSSRLFFSSFWFIKTFSNKIYKVLIFVSRKKKRLLLSLSSLSVKLGLIAFLRKLLCLGLYSLLDVGESDSRLLLQLFTYHPITFKSLIEINTWKKSYHVISRRISLLILKTFFLELLFVQTFSIRSTRFWYSV